MRFWNLNKVEVKVEVETRLAKGEAEMKSSRFDGVNRRLSGFGYLTFASALVVMFASPAFGSVSLEKNLWAFTEKEGEVKLLDHASDKTREEFLSKLDKVNVDNLVPVKEALELFKSDDAPFKTKALIESVADAFVKASEDEKTAEEKTKAVAEAIRSAVTADEDSLGEAFDKKGAESKDRAEGLEQLMDKVQAWMKSKKFKFTEEELAAFIEKTLKANKGKLLAKLGMTDVKPTKKKPEGEDKAKKDEELAKKKADEEAAKKKADEELAKKKTDEENKAKGQGGQGGGQQVGGGQVAGTEAPAVPCPVQGRDPLIDFLSNMRDQFARLQRQANPGDDLLGLADALNKNRNSDNATPPQQAQQAFPPSNNNSKPEEAPQESLAKDTPPAPQPNPAFGDTGAPIIANTALKKPTYKQVAEDGARETQELSNDVSQSKALAKRADTLISSGLQQLQQGMFLPNGQVNPWGFSAAMGTINSTVSKLRAQATNVTKSLEWAKTRLAALNKDIKKATAENSRGEEAEKSLKEFGQIEQQLTANLQQKSSECGSAQLPQEQQSCKQAQAQLTSALTNIKAKKEEQQALISKGDKNFEDSYVAELKESASALAAQIKAGEAEASNLEDKAAEVERSGSTLQGTVASAMAPQTGGTTGAKLSAPRNGGGRTVTANGGFQGSAAGTGRPSYGAK